MFGFASRRKARQIHINRINVGNSEYKKIKKSERELIEQEKQISSKHSNKNIDYYKKRESIIENIEMNLKSNSYDELTSPIYDGTNALIYCCKNIETRHMKYLRKRSFAKLLKELIMYDYGLLQIDNNGVFGLMYLCQSITKEKYIEIVEMYLDVLYSKYGIRLRNLLLQKDNQSKDIYYYINMNYSNNECLKASLRALINVYL